MDDSIYKIILDVLLKYIGEGIHIIDSEERTIVYNEAMERLEGMDRNDVIDKSLLEIFPSLNESTSTLCKVLKERKPIIERCQTYTNREGHKITTINSTLPLLDGDKIIGSLEISKDLTGLKSLYDKINYLQQELFSEYDKNKRDRLYRFNDLIGCGLQFLNAVEIAKKAALTTSSVLIYGETGTGKELIAQSIHSSSDRKDMPFIAQNCAALPESLLEGILFGTAKGSFTGAINRPGLFEQANKGTLLLDEINSMDIGLQSKLLRVLQEGYVRRVGGLNDIPVDVRIIATTNSDPMLEIKEERLRKDLYYRISVVHINLPPLRDRREDIPLLTKHFINQYNRTLSKDVWDVSEEVERELISYSWPGNVRELKNYIEGAMNMISAGHIIGREHFTPNIQLNLFRDSFADYNPMDFDTGLGLDETLNMMEKKIISDTLKKCDGNISKCSRILKIKRQTLQHKIKRYNIII